MKDSEPPDNEDDGWGEAADAAAAPASEAAIDNEWDDPADLEKRVAALRVQRDSMPAPVSGEVITGATSSSASNESGTPTDLTPGAPTDLTPGAPTDLTPGAPTDLTPGAPTENSPASLESPRSQASESDSMANRDEALLPTPSANLLAAAGLAPDVPTEADDKSTRQKRREKKSKKPAKAPKQASAGDSSPLLTARQKKFIVGGSVALVLAAICAILGWFNSQNYYLSCGTKSITATQGRFWPWGTSPLPGPAFKAIHVPSDVLCTNQHFESRTLLEEAFLDALLKQSTGLLTSGDAEHVDTAEQQLEQALLLTRAPERSAQRTLAQRLEGDVAYWRGAAQVQAAAELLEKGASHFEEAAAKRPRHTSDANAWATHARFLESEIGKGPSVLRKDETPKEQPTFQGLSPDVAPPVNTPNAAPPPLQSAPPDAGVPQAPKDAAIPPSDAALPKGGVLL